MCITKGDFAANKIATFALSSIERTNVFAAPKEDATDFMFIFRYSRVAKVKLASSCLKRKLFLARRILTGTVLPFFLPST